MKVAKVALKCFATLAVTGLLAVGVLWGCGMIDQTTASHADNREYAAATEFDNTPNSVSEIRQYEPNALDTADENDDKGIGAMESPTFQEIIDKMRQLSADEIDDMYEQFKNEMPKGAELN